MSAADETAKSSEQPPQAVAPRVDEGTSSATGPASATTNPSQASSNSPTATATATQSPTAHATTISGTNNPFADDAAATTTRAADGVDTVESTPALPPRPEPTNTRTETMTSHIHFGDELPPLTTHETDAPPQQTQTHPGVAQLKGMFPDFDDALLESVLSSVNYNEEAAVEVLLGMSDPDYVSSHAQQPAAAAAEPTSLELDEALARQLQLEDDREAAHGRSWQPARPATGQTWQRRSADGRDGDVPYATREGHPHPPPPGQGADFNEIKETFNQIAESGKRSFSSIFSKVKAKINEFDTGNRSQQPGGYDQHPPPSWGTSSASGPAGNMDRHAASQYYGSGPTQPANSNTDEDGWTRVGRDRGYPQQQQQLQQQPAVTSASPPPTQPMQAPVRGYDLDDDIAAAPASTIPPIAPNHPPTSSSPPSQPPLAQQAPTQPIPVPAPTSSTSDTGTPRPPTTQAGSPLNVTKFGLLPKRPVSLLSPQGSGVGVPGQGQTRAGDEDDEEEDELDYVENPFDSKRSPK